MNTVFAKKKQKLLIAHESYLKLFVHH